MRATSAEAMCATFEERYVEARARGRWTAAVLVVRELLDVANTVVHVRARLGDRGGVRAAGGFLISDITKELKIGLRTLTRRPSFLVLATVTLALGIGANTAVFSVVDTIVLRPLPYPDSERIVRVWHTLPRLGWERGPFSYPNFAGVRAGAPSLAAWATITENEATLIEQGPPMRVRGALVSGSFFSLLGVRAELGRTILPADAEPSAEPVALLSHGLWMRAFGGDPGVIGSSFRLEGRSSTIVGVMPPDFTGTSAVHEYWLPHRLDEAGRAADTNYLQVLARLGPGVTVAEAQGEVGAVLARLAESNPDDRERRAFVETLHASLVGDVRAQLLLLLGAVTLVLVAACANVAGLTLARTANRHREHAVRLALGAGRRRLVLHLFAESSLVALAGGLVGVGVAHGLVRALASFSPGGLPRRDELAVEPGALLFLFGISAICVFFFGLLPALRGSGTPAADALRDRSGPAGGRARVHQVLVALQIALALLLMIGAGLLGTSFARLQSVDPGFDADGVLVATVPLPFEDNAERIAFVDRLLRRVEGLPGVETAGLAWSVPFGTAWGSTRVVAEGSDAPLDERPNAQMIPLRGDAFGSLGLTLVEGRDDLSQVAAQDPLTVVVNETFARTLWPGQTAVGKRFRRGTSPDAPWNTVVGVVADTKATSLSEPPPLMLYQPLTQAGWIQDGQLLARVAAGDPLSLVANVRAIVAEQDPTLPVTDVATLRARVSDSVTAPRFRAGLVGSFALLVTVLAAVGVYGVMGLFVAGRVRDIGVRMALGAERATVLLEVLRSAAVFTVPGLAVGLMGALGISGTLRALLFEVPARDPTTYLAACALLVTTTAVAMLVPARRAASVQPMDVLRQD
jgi:putative ABC transport system permease protein